MTREQLLEKGTIYFRLPKVRKPEFIERIRKMNELMEEGLVSCGTIIIDFTPEVEEKPEPEEDSTTHPGP